MKRLSNIGDALSQLANVLFLPDPDDTDANESISGRAYREGWLYAQNVINGLVFWRFNHCREAYEKDVARAKRLLES